MVSEDFQEFQSAHGQVETPYPSSSGYSDSSASSHPTNDSQLYQTPGEALRHKHFIKGAIVKTVVGFLLNFGIAALIQIGKNKIFLWAQPDTFESDGIEFKAGTRLWLELFLTITLSVLIGHPISAWRTGFEIKKGEAIPIKGEDLQKYSMFGVTSKYRMVCALILTLYSVFLVFGPTILILWLACDYGGMSRVPIPPTFDPDGACYVSKMTYLWLKSIIAAIGTLFIVWAQEWAFLNRDMISDEVFEEYRKQKLGEAVDCPQTTFASLDILKGDKGGYESIV